MDTQKECIKQLAKATRIGLDKLNEATAKHIQELLECSRYRKRYLTSNMNIINAEEARKKSQEVMDEKIGHELREIMEAIQDAIAEGKVRTRVESTLPYSSQLIERLKGLGYKVEYGQGWANNCPYEDKGKLTIYWGQC